MTGGHDVPPRVARLCYAMVPLCVVRRVDTRRMQAQGQRGTVGRASASRLCSATSMYSMLMSLAHSASTAPQDATVRCGPRGAT